VVDTLGSVIDAVSEDLQQGRDFDEDERENLVRWLIERQVAGGRDAGAFAPSAEDLHGKGHLYTGEPLRTKLAIWNVFTAETARLLTLLRTPRVDVSEALDRAAQWLGLRCFSSSGCVIGECAHSFVGYVRYLNARDEDPASLVRHVNVFRKHRDGKGRWHRFPFYYALLTLTEIGSDAARNELHYALPALRRVRNRKTEDEVFGRRRKEIIDRVLGLEDLRLL
jgi:hypothetical protein